MPWAISQSAVRRIISSFSTEHGPAMIVKWRSPKVPCGSRTIVSCSCISRLASLYGLVTRISSNTPGRTSSVRGIDRAGVARDPDRRPRGAGHRVRRQAHLADRFEDPLDLVRRGVALHHDEHDRCCLAGFGVYRDGVDRVRRFFPTIVAVPFQGLLPSSLGSQISSSS